MTKNKELDLDEIKKAAKEAFVKALNGFNVEEKPSGKLVANLDELNGGAKIGIEVWPLYNGHGKVYMAFLVGENNIGHSFYEGFQDVKTIIPGEWKHGCLKDIDALKDFITKIFVPNVFKVLKFIKNSDKKLNLNPIFMDEFAYTFNWGKPLDDKKLERMFYKIK